jgi:signal peptide peptidase SppA
VSLPLALAALDAGDLWALAPQALEDLRAYAEQIAWSDRPPAPPSIRQPVAKDTRVVDLAEARAARVALIPVHGVLTRRRSIVTEILGGNDTLTIRRQVGEALLDPTIKRLVLDVDSPGGTVAGMAELAAYLRAARRIKPVTAVANARAASAAYWLASQASELVVTPSGEVGSIGVVAVHEDRGRALAQAGVAVTLVSAGRYKTDGNPFGPLSASARAAEQERVDTAFSAFVEDVARGRRRSATEARNGFGQGRMVSALEAVRLGMADRVGTLDAEMRRA